MKREEALALGISPATLDGREVDIARLEARFRQIGVWDESLAEIISVLASIQYAAGPWVPGEPPEECKDGEQELLAWVRDGGRTLVRIVRWIEDMGVGHEDHGGIWDDGRYGWTAADIKFHARINPPKPEGPVNDMEKLARKFMEETYGPMPRSASEPDEEVWMARFGLLCSFCAFLEDKAPQGHKTKGGAG